MEVDIKTYIEQMLPQLAGCLYPVFTTDLSKTTVAYNFTPIRGGHLKQSSLELRIIGEDFDQCEAVRHELEGILDMEEDQGFVVSGKTRFHSELAGGGCLYGEAIQRYENTVIYTIDWRNIA